MKKILTATILCFLSTTYASAEWVEPSGKACINNGGEIKHGSICYADHDTAERICSAVDAKLPTIDALEEAVKACGGELNSHSRKEDDPSFQACYQKKGFSIRALYWSSSTHEENSTQMILMHFGKANGETFYGPKNYKEGGVICVK